MPIWEYKVVELASNLYKLEDLKLNAQEEILYKLGKEGWELISVVTPSYPDYGDDVIAYLKRPAQQ